MEEEDDPEVGDKIQGRRNSWRNERHKNTQGKAKDNTEKKKRQQSGQENGKKARSSTMDP